jgi:hypothetical protein
MYCRFSSADLGLIHPHQLETSDFGGLRLIALIYGTLSV